MAKKKQLAGKKTKLAKLPLTQVLAGQAEEPAPWGPPSGAHQLPLARGEAREGAAGPLAVIYLDLVQELSALKSQLQPGLTGAPQSGATPGSSSPQIHRALRPAGKILGPSPSSPPGEGTAFGLSSTLLLPGFQL
jgi:hypothetical protein